MTAHELADEYVGFRKRVDIWANLWMGELEYLEEWDDPSPEGTDTTEAAYGDFQRRAGALVQAADASARELLDTVSATAEVARLTHGLTYDIQTPNPETGLLGYLVPFLPRYPLVTAEHGDRYLVKLEGFAAFADRLAERMAVSSARGVVPLRSHAERLVSLLDARIDDPSRFLAQPAPTDGWPGWQAALERAVRGPLVSGLRSYRNALAEHAVPHGRSDGEAGLLHLAGGADLYANLVRAYTTQDISADEVHRVGLEQVARLSDEYRAIAGPLVGSDDVGSILQRLRTDPDLHYRDAGTLIADALTALARAEAEAPRWFNRVPVVGCDAVATDSGALAFYSDPPEAGGRGTFFFNAGDPTVWSTFGLEAITYHESVPGHHFQIALAIEDPTLHHVQQRMYIAAFNEGWGLYAERLADEMGLYSSELARVGMLQADSMRACRLVVDTGMHALGWSRQEAIDYMVANAPMNHQEVAAEVDRYISDPGQALGYMIGRLEIDRVRASAEATLGDRFDIRGFHDAILGAGTITLATLKARVDAWVATS